MTDIKPVGTSANQDRRVLHFTTIDQAMAEVDQLAAHADTLKSTGNWSPGTIIGHLGKWVQWSFEGVPMWIPPKPLQMLLKLTFKKSFIWKPMPAGKKIPGVANGTLGNEPMDLQQALALFRQMFTRLKNECPARPHPLFGIITHEEWINFHLRHAELHLGFLKA